MHGIDKDKVQVHKLSASGKPLLAQGAFGHVSIALGVIAVPTTRSFAIHYLAIKDIRNAIQIQYASPDQSSSAISNEWDPAGVVKSEGENHSSKLTKEALCELAALRTLTRDHHHPCITQLLSVIESDRDPFSLSLVFPYGLIDLATVIENQGRSLNLNLKFIQEPLLKTIMGDILSALDFCHSKGILHRDVKPGNCIISIDGHVQLTDFGLAKTWTIQSSFNTVHHDSINVTDDNDYNVSSSRSRSQAQCTLHYRSPELLFNADPSGYEVDMWGCGLILAELINLRPLFPGRTVFDQIGRIFYVLGTPNEGNWADAEKLNDFRKLSFKPQLGIGLLRAIPRLLSYDSSMSQLLANLLSLNPMKRPSAGQCRSHSWLTSFPSASPHSELLESLIPVKLRVSQPLLDTVPFDDEQSLPAVLDFHRERASALALARRDINTSNPSFDNHHTSINLALLAGLVTKLRLTEP